ncbi:nuclear transport factor 2 family protein [Gangjinia marincola]|uniref:Nuclear transport factor 2 family protein n=1 Tax=Gangjinia marincola TaxID=578463 RepID=A0ABP3XRA3_9FLAO
MRRLVLILLISLSAEGIAQETIASAEAEVKTTIQQFFTDFHAQDTVGLKQRVSDKILMQTLVPEANGKHHVAQVNFSVFAASIAGIPTTTTFREDILDYTIMIDGAMAHAWTPYRFYINDELSHCGVNSFTLVKEEETWMIAHIIDTRRKEDCE